MQRMTTLVLALALLTCALGCQTKSSLPIIDTHIHLYDTSRPQGVPWPQEKDSVIYRPVLAKDYMAVAKANNVTATVIVEASVWPEDNYWALEETRHNKDVFIALVGNLEVAEPNFPEAFERLKRDPRLVGFRLRSYKYKPYNLADEQVLANLKLIAEAGMTVEFLPGGQPLPGIIQLAKTIPNLRIILDHNANIHMNGQPVPEEMVDLIKQAAAQPNIYCKVSAIFQQSRQWPSPKNLDNYRHVLDLTWNAFGQDRLMYGSNWPVTDKGGTFADQLNILKAYFQPHGDAVMQKVFWKNAVKIYKLKFDPADY